MINRKIPLIDLHRHLDGSIRLQTILDLAQQHDLPLPAKNLEELRPLVQIMEPQPGVMAFIAKFEWMVGVLADYDACRRIAYENVLDAQSEGIHYIELRFSPLFMAQPHHLNTADVVSAVLDGLEQGAEETGVKVNAIGILSRHYGPKMAMQELNALLGYKQRLVALDLAGDEANFPGQLFVEHFKIARAEGWHITVHAGEAAGAESIWQAVEELGAQRIGHGARLMEDPLLVETVFQNKIGVETNLTSNVQTSTVASYEEHPLKAMLQADLLATINTDDPGISAIDLPHEYETAAPAVGLSTDQIQIAQANAVDIAFLSAEEKEALREQVKK
jgi:adenosine deaminase